MERGDEEAVESEEEEEEEEEGEVLGVTFVWNEGDPLSLECRIFSSLCGCGDGKIGLVGVYAICEDGLAGLFRLASIVEEETMNLRMGDEGGWEGKEMAAEEEAYSASAFMSSSPSIG